MLYSAVAVLAIPAMMVGGAIAMAATPLVANAGGVAAVLAMLGGGTLASGGFGMMGGVAMLGGGAMLGVSVGMKGQLDAKAKLHMIRMSNLEYRRQFMHKSTKFLDVVCKILADDTTSISLHLKNVMAGLQAKSWEKFDVELLELINTIKFKAYSFKP